MRRSTTYWLAAVLVLSGLAAWAVREARVARAELSYMTARWAECEAELESYRE